MVSYAYGEGKNRRDDPAASVCFAALKAGRVDRRRGHLRKGRSGRARIGN